MSSRRAVCLIISISCFVRTTITLHSGNTMSTSTTSSPTPSSALPPTYATLSFHKSNIIRLLHFPQELTSALEAVILASWPLGLESHGPFDQSYEYKVKGSPFGHYRSQQYVGAVRLLRDVLACLHAHNWELVTSVLCSRRYTSKDTLIFHRRRVDAALPPPAPVEWLALAPTGNNKLRVVYDGPGVRLCGGDGDRDNDHDHLGVLIASIRKVLFEMDYFEKGAWSYDSFEFDLKGWPWRSRGAASVKMRVMLVRLLETMAAHGWRLYTTTVLRTGKDDFKILDTWYFVRGRGEGDNGAR